MAESVHIIVTSGTREKLQMAAMITAVAAAGGSDVSVFLSMNALVFFKKQAIPEVPCEGEVGRLLVTKKAPHFLDLFAQAVDIGSVKIYPCSMAMDVLALGQEDLVPYMERPMGLTKFLSELGTGPVLSF